LRIKGQATRLTPPFEHDDDDDDDDDDNNNNNNKLTSKLQRCWPTVGRC